MRILLVEDDKELCEAIKLQLEKAGYETDCCGSGQEAFYYAAEFPYDVILLDRVQTLFVPVFHIDPKSVIDALGKAYTVVLAWPGYVNDGLLCYDKFDGTESIRISAADYTVWEVE